MPGVGTFVSGFQGKDESQFLNVQIIKMQQYVNSKIIKIIFIIYLLYTAIDYWGMNYIELDLNLPIRVCRF